MKPQYIRKFQIFKRLLNKEDPVIVEIGAHFGEDAVRFSETFSKAVIHCFEPDPRCIEVFKKYVNNERIFLHEFALSDSDGESLFYQSFQETNQLQVPNKYDWIDNSIYHRRKLNNSGSSSLKKGYPHILKPIKVSTKRFDNWSSENEIGKIDLAWIDVQGAEKDVISGMGEQVYKIKFIWVEYGEKQYSDAMNRDETIRFMRTLNFKAIEQLSDSSSSGDILFMNEAW